MLCCWSGDHTHNCLSRSIQYNLNRRQQLPVLKEAETIQRSKKDLPGTLRQAEGKGFLSCASWTAEELVGGPVAGTW